MDITDRRLVRGIYFRNLKDYDEKMIAQTQISLADRIIGFGGTNLTENLTENKNNQAPDILMKLLNIPTQMMASEDHIEMK